MAGMTLLQICASYTEADDLIEALRTLAKCDSGVADGFEDSFAIGVMAAYIAGLNKDRAERAAAEPRPLTDAEIDGLLVHVSITKLERLLADRREADRVATATAHHLADTVEELEETLSEEQPWLCMTCNLASVAEFGDSCDECRGLA